MSTQRCISVISKRKMAGWMDGWMTCDFMSFLTVFRSYQDDGRMIMKGCVQWNPVYDKKISPRAGLELGTARSVGQCLR